MLFRRSSQLALQATLLLALEPDGSSRRIRELADELGIAAPYLTKIIQNLTRAGLVQAIRGPHGGVKLAHPAEDIHPWDVFAALEPVSEFTQCLLGTRQCNGETACPLHGTWAPAREEIFQALQTKNLREFAAEAKRSPVPFWQPGSPSSDFENREAGKYSTR
jgi:Rrf2 family protein